jgi:hypothetical protein
MVCPVAAAMAATEETRGWLGPFSHRAMFRSDVLIALASCVWVMPAFSRACLILEPSMRARAVMQVPSVACQGCHVKWSDEICHCHDIRIGAGLPLVAGGLTPEMLLQRLVVAYDATNEEGLAGKTPNSLRTLKRWKQIGFPQTAQDLLDLLEEANLLRSTKEAAADDGSAARRLQQLAGAVAEVLQSQREMGEHLRDVQARLARAEAALSHGRSAPKRKRA